MEKINTIRVGDKPVAQGDVLIIPLGDREFPEDLKSVAPSGDGEFVVAHSETGHHHVIEARPDIELFEPTTREFEEISDTVEMYLNVIRADVTLRHLRDFDTHKPISLPPGKYKLRRQTESSPEGFRLAVD